MDAKLRNQILKEVASAVAVAMESYQEQWVTAQQLSKQIAFFTPSWLKSYGHMLPRERVTIASNEETHRTGWCYPLHKIQRMITNGDFRFLQ